MIIQKSPRLYWPHYIKIYNCYWLYMKLQNTLVYILIGVFSLQVNAASLDNIENEGIQKLSEAQASQLRIDKVVESAQQRLIKYRALLKQAEGLKAYNEQLSTQVASQNNLLERFDQSIYQVALIERQMAPLVEKMADALEDFVEIDIPFHIQERRERIQFIKESLAASDINVAEKFRQMIEAYQIENEYGRKISSYQDIIELDGEQREVDILQVGRIALLCQTKDTKISARWNHDEKKWQILDNAIYRNAIRNGVKMAKKQASINILNLPISAPNSAQ